MDKDEAIKFFSEFYRGEHHFPSELKPCGDGWSIRHAGAEYATYDFNELTRLVLMAHHYCIRVGIEANGFNGLKIRIWKRKREGKMFERHPTIEQVLEEFNQSHPQKELENESN